MSNKEFEKAKEADRLSKHPEKNKIKKIQKMINREKDPRKNFTDDDWENFYIDKDLAEVVEELGYLNETINLDIQDNIATLSGDSGEYEGEIYKGKVSFSVIYDDLDTRITDQYDESNIEEFLGKNHAFVELSKKYNHNWNIEPDLVGITIELTNILSISSPIASASSPKSCGDIPNTSCPICFISLLDAIDKF